MSEQVRSRSGGMPSGEPPPRTQWLRRYRWNIAASVLVILLAVACGGIAYWQYTAPQRQAMERLQGHWQLVESNGKSRVHVQFYMTVSGNEAHVRQFEPDGRLAVIYRWRLVPLAGHDFIRFRSSEVDRNRYEPEYHMLVEDEKLTRIRGVWRKDNMKEPRIETWRRVQTVPATTAPHGTLSTSD